MRDRQDIAARRKADIPGRGIVRQAATVSVIP